MGDPQRRFTLTKQGCLGVARQPMKGFEPILCPLKGYLARPAAPRDLCAHAAKAKVLVASPSERSAHSWGMRALASRPKITLAEMRLAGVHCMLITLLLSGCSSVEMSPVTHTVPSPPTQAAVVAGAKAAATVAKLSPPLEVSDVRPTDHGPGSYFVCIREVVNSTSEKRPAYSVFYNNDDYKGERLSVILDACEIQAFTPIDIAPPPTPSKSSQSPRKPANPKS
jgi:hypothetical protein